MSNVASKQSRFFLPFLRAVTALGALALIYSLFNINPSHLDLRFAALVLMSLLLSSRIVVPIPRLSSQISVSDTFVFLTLLLYGGPAAVVVGSTEAIVSSLRFSRKRQTVLFNWGCAALSVFITSSILTLGFGNVVSLPRQPLSTGFVVALCTI